MLKQSWKALIAPTVLETILYRYKKSTMNIDYEYRKLYISVNLIYAIVRYLFKIGCAISTERRIEHIDSVSRRDLVSKFGRKLIPCRGIYQSGRGNSTLLDIELIAVPVRAALSSCSSSVAGFYVTGISHDLLVRNTH